MIARNPAFFSYLKILPDDLRYPYLCTQRLITEQNGNGPRLPTPSRDTPRVYNLAASSKKKKKKTLVSFENRIRPFIKFYVTFPLSLSILIIIIDVSFRINLLANFVFRVSNFHSQLISLDLIESNFILLCDDETFTTIDFDFFFFIKVSSSSNRSLIRTKKKK